MKIDCIAFVLTTVFNIPVSLQDDFSTTIKQEQIQILWDSIGWKVNAKYGRINPSFATIAKIASLVCRQRGFRGQLPLFWLCFTHRALHRLNNTFRLPVSFCGPMKPTSSVKRPKEKIRENPIVQNMNTPNCMKNWISAANMKSDAPRVVQAPEKTDGPISSNMSLVRWYRSLWSDNVYPSAKWTT